MQVQAGQRAVRAIFKPNADGPLALLAVIAFERLVGWAAVQIVTKRVRPDIDLLAVFSQDVASLR